MRRSTILQFLSSTPFLKGSKVRLRQKHLKDTMDEYCWRQDEEICRLDATTPITSTFEEYMRWYADNQEISRNSYILSIETLDGMHIGNCGCFNIDDVKCEMEMGIIIGDKGYWNNGYGEDAVKTLVINLMQYTHVGRIYLKTLDWNCRAHRCFEKCGFVPCGRLDRLDQRFIIMEMKRPKAAQMD
ncbi:MAG TPA: GNAT family N-acetyltransferase [Dehalococcoidia bacterium]|nr:GNAT family N-acetyltransferase [Dehalococcoidia bacterium]